MSERGDSHDPGQAARLEALLESARGLAAETEPDRLLQQLLGSAARSFGADGGGIARWDPHGGRLLQVASTRPDMRNAVLEIPLESACGIAALERRTCIINEYQRRFRDTTPAGQAGSSAVMAAPLIHDGVALGAISINRYAPDHPFTQDDAHTLEALAGIGAAVLARLDAEEQLRLQARRLLVLSETSRRLGQLRHDLGPLLQQVADLLSEQIGDGCSVHMAGDDGEGLRLVALAHPNHRAVAELRRQIDFGALQVHDSMARAVMESGEARLVPHVTDAGMASSLLPDQLTIARRLGVRSVVAAPLTIEGRLTGLVRIWRGDGAPPYTEDDRLMLQDLAGRASQAITNARHVKHREDQVERLRALTRLNSLISSSLDLGAVLQEIVDAAATLMNTPVVQVWMADEERRTLTLRAASRGAEPSDYLNFVRSYGSGASGWVAEHRQPLAIDDFERDPRVGYPWWWIERGMRSYHGVPIFDGDRLLAVLAIIGDRAPAVLPENHDLLASFVAQATVAIRNAALFAAEAEARQAAEAASNAKSEFLATVSHEVRTPLNGIMGMAQVLLVGSLPREHRDAIETIVSSGNVLLEVINDILDYSKLEAQQLELAVAVLDVRRVVEEARGVVSGLASQKGIPINLMLNLPPDLVVFGDPARLRQVLTNLLGNAVKFTPAGAIRVRCWQAAETADSATIRFEVEDTGIGIAPDTLTRVFEPFMQADSSTTRRYGGTGLGLAICRRIVNMMGGQIGVESQVGLGSTFWFTIALARRAPAASLPSDAGVPAAQVADVPPLEPSTRSRILVAEDNPINQRVTLRLLTRLGYDAEAVANGEEAVQAVMSEQYAAVLMDCQMPGLDGFEAARAVRRWEAERGPAETADRLPIIALTASVMSADRARCFDAGMDDFLSKPVTLRMLDEVLSRWTTPIAT